MVGRRRLSAAGEGGQEGDEVAVVDGVIPLDELIVDGGFDDVGVEGHLAIGLDFVEELAGGLRFGLIGHDARAARGAEQRKIADGDGLHGRADYSPKSNRRPFCA